jgi:hypothetical protein
MNQPALVEVPRSTVSRYIEANKELEHRLGKSPGVEFLMSLAVEQGDPSEIVEEFLGTIVENMKHNPN